MHRRKSVPAWNCLAYRMEVKISYETGVVVVGRLGTHGEYSRWIY